MNSLKKIPYGISSYKTIRQENCYYVDKTHFIPALERAGNFLFLIRPRRFGKSSLLTVLESYYDIARQDEYEFLFNGTTIYDQPTPEKHAYLILKFNFSQVDPRPDEVEASFHAHAKTCFYFFGKSYRNYLDDDYFFQMETYAQAHQKLEFLFRYVGSLGRKVYVLIDEYDNFANTILSTAGAAAYHELTHGTGFFRFFFNILKGAGDQVDSGLGRIFITGVSPVTMDDVTSGFNIGTNISLDQSFNELLGFSEADVQTLCNYYRAQADLIPDAQEMSGLMQTWYNGYRFSSKAAGSLYNPDMVLYFIKALVHTGAYPDEMIDQNVRIDYGKLRHLMVLERRLNGNFEYLRSVLQAQGTSPMRVIESFPVEHLTKSSNFLSLLFYFGLLSYAENGELGIPNQTVKELLYGYLRDAYEDVNVFALDLVQLAELMRRMAYQGEWEPVFRFLADEIRKQTSIRDYLKGEKVIQTFLLAYLNVTDYYLTRTEEELGKGWVDLYLEPFWQKYDQVRYGYLIELKYVKRDEWSEARGQTELQAAGEQLQRYAHDPRISRSPHLICVALVFCGWELKLAEEFFRSAK